MSRIRVSAGTMEMNPSSSATTAESVAGDMARHRNRGLTLLSPWLQEQSAIISIIKIAGRCFM